MPEREKHGNIVWKLKIPVISVASAFVRYRAGKLSFLAFIIVLLSLVVGGLSCTQEGTEQCEAFSVIQDVLKR